MTTKEPTDIAIGELSEAVVGLAGLQERIQQFISTKQWEDWQKDIPIQPDRNTANTSSATDSEDAGITLETSIQRIQTLLLDTKQHCQEMSEEAEFKVNERRSVVSVGLEQCQNDMANLRHELNFAKKCVNDLETNLSIGNSAPECDMEPHAIGQRTNLRLDLLLDLGAHNFPQNTSILTLLFPSFPWAGLDRLMWRNTNGTWKFDSKGVLFKMRKLFQRDTYIHAVVLFRMRVNDTSPETYLPPYNRTHGMPLSSSHPLINYIKRRVVDAALYTTNAAAGQWEIQRSKIFFRSLNAAFHTAASVLSPLHFHHQHNPKPKESLTLEKCGNLAELEKPYNYNAFVVSTSDADQLNTCNGLTTAQTFFFRNGFINDHGGNEFLEKNGQTILYEMYHFTEAFATKSYKVPAAVEWIHKISTTCRTQDEMLATINVNDKLSPLEQNLMKLYIVRESYERPPSAATTQDAQIGIAMAAATVTTVGVVAVAGVIGAIANAVASTAKAADSAADAVGGVSNVASTLGDGLNDVLEDLRRGDTYCEETTSTTTTTTTTTTATTTTTTTATPIPSDAECLLNNPDLEKYPHLRNTPPSPCGAEEPNSVLKRLSDLKDESVVDDGTVSGIHNLPDLLLSRGLGYFPNWDRAQTIIDTENQFMCQKHRVEFGQGGNSNFLLKFHRRAVRGQVKCGVDQLPGVTAHSKAVSAKLRTFLTRKESEIVLKRKNVFIPTGTRKHFLKGEYKMQLKETSRSADLCFRYALSDPASPAHNIPCDHLHQLDCPQCEALKGTLRITDQIMKSATIPDQMLKREAMHVVSRSIDDIKTYKAHIVRSVYQDIQKEKILGNLEGDTVFITLDWYGKKGMSLHIAYVQYRPRTSATPEGETAEKPEILSRTYAHFLYRDDQSHESTTAILRHILEQIKKELFSVKNAILRSDNAGCYHSSQTIATLPYLSKVTGIHISRYTFSEPQSGKGPSDRMGALIKNHIRKYVAEGHEMSNGEEFIAAMNSYGGVRSVSAYHVSLRLNPVDRQENRRPNRKAGIPGISKFYDFVFDTPNTLKVWRFKDIGVGQTVNGKYFLNGKHNTGVLNILGESHFGGAAPVRGEMFLSVKKPRPQAIDPPKEQEPMEDSEAEPHTTTATGGLEFPCPEPGCIHSYQFYGNLLRHIDGGKHKFQPSRITLRDYAIDKYKEALEGSNEFGNFPMLAEALQETERYGETSDVAEKQGWALPFRRAVTKFDDNQRNYLIDAFNYGVTTGKKLDAKKVEKSMRHAKQQGQPRFTATDFLNYRQIASFFSRLAKEQRKIPKAQDGQRDSEQIDALMEDVEVADTEFIDENEIFQEMPDEILDDLRDKRELEISVYRLREENGRLRDKVKGLQREVLMFRTQQLRTEMYAQDSCEESHIENGHRERNGIRNGIPLDDNVLSRIAALEAELSQSKEALNAMKSDRKRLKGEKCELLNQMKEVYQTLEGKERELRDFIRQYEQRMRDSDRDMKGLVGEKERTEDEKKKLAITLLETQQTVTQLHQGLQSKESENGKLLAQLKELQGRFFLLTGQSISTPPIGGVETNGAQQQQSRNQLRTPSVGYASLPVSPASLIDESPPENPNRNVRLSRQLHGTSMVSSPSMAIPVPSPEVKTVLDLPASLRHKSRGRSPKPKTDRNRLSRLFHLGGSRSKSQSKDGNEAMNQSCDYQTIPDDPITADMNRIDQADRLIEARKMNASDWKQSHVQAWLELELGLTAAQRNGFARNVKSGKVLLGLTDSDLSSVLHVTEPLQKKKLRLAIEEYRVPSLCKYPSIREVSWQYVSSHLLPACGLSQYVDIFRKHLVDGRILNQLTKKQLEKYLGISNKFHQNSILKAVELLRLFKFDIKALYRRRSETETAAPFEDLLVWTNQRFLRWLEHIDLDEYKTNISESGICGAVMVLDSSFTVDTLAGILGISAKPMVRKHLAAEFGPLLMEARSRWSNEEHRRLVAVSGARRRQRSSTGGDGSLAGGGRPSARSCSPATARSAADSSNWQPQLEQQTTTMESVPLKNGALLTMAAETPKRRGLRGSFGKMFGLKTVGRLKTTAGEQSPSLNYLSESKSMNDSVLSTVLKESGLSTGVIDANNSSTMSSTTSDLGSSIERSDHMKTILGTSQVLKQPTLTANLSSSAVVSPRSVGDRETSPSCGVTTVKLRSKSAGNKLNKLTASGGGGIRPHSVHDFSVVLPPPSMPSTNPNARRHKVATSSYETSFPAYVSPIHYGHLESIDNGHHLTTTFPAAAEPNHQLSLSACCQDGSLSSATPPSDHRNMQTISEMTEPDPDTVADASVSEAISRPYLIGVPNGRLQLVSTESPVSSPGGRRGVRPHSLSIIYGGGGSPIVGGGGSTRAGKRTHADSVDFQVRCLDVHETHL